MHRQKEQLPLEAWLLGKWSTIEVAKLATFSFKTQGVDRLTAVGLDCGKGKQNFQYVFPTLELDNLIFDRNSSENEMKRLPEARSCACVCVCVWVWPQLWLLICIAI